MDLDRRTFLRYAGRTGAGLAVLGTSGGLLAACGSDDKTSAAADTTSTTAGKAALGAMSMQLNWISDFEFAGSYVADDKGYWTDAGFDSVALLPGGAAVQVEPKVVAGNALLAYAQTANVVAANAKGADLKVIGAGMQKNPLVLLSLKEKPILTPADIPGAKIGIPVNSENVWAAFLEYNKIDPGSYTKVPVQFDPSPLTNGEVDAIMSFATNQPITVELAGHQTALLYLADYGFAYPEQLYIVQAKSLTERKDELVAAMAGERLGWKDVFADPQVGIDLTMSKYGDESGLDATQQLAGLKKLLPLMEGKAALFAMSDELIASAVESLKRLKLDVDASLFTNEILDAI
ncbi:MAG: transporter substrate-binding protein [Actinomycetia bacterium]|nr:transporter substrate-binding protein [Actinomycetes bacterium]